MTQILPGGGVGGHQGANSMAGHSGSEAPTMSNYICKHICISSCKGICKTPFGRINNPSGSNLTVSSTVTIPQYSDNLQQNIRETKENAYFMLSSDGFLTYRVIIFLKEGGSSPFKNPQLLLVNPDRHDTSRGRAAGNNL